MSVISSGTGARSPQCRDIDPFMRAPSSSPWPSPLNASDVASAVHRTVALQKNGGGGFSAEPLKSQLDSVDLNSVVLGGFPTLRRTLLKPLGNLALLLVFFRVIKFLSPLRLPISPPGQCSAKRRIMAQAIVRFDHLRFGGTYICPECLHILSLQALHGVVFGDTART